MENFFNFSLWNERFVLLLLTFALREETENLSFDRTPRPRWFNVRVVTISMLLFVAVHWPYVRSIWIIPDIGILNLVKERYFEGSWLYWSYMALLHLSTIRSLMKLLGLPVSPIKLSAKFSVVVLIQISYITDGLRMDGFLFLKYFSRM